MRYGAIAALGLCVLSLGACGDDRDLPCAGYPGQARSPYVLPWPVGLEFTVLTGNCHDGIPTHSGDRRYAYDIRMPFGARVTAARGGTVVSVVEHHSDDDHVFGHENRVTVSHGDGTYALYIHLARNGAAVEEGDVVEQGEEVGIVGTSGSIGDAMIPHLHFEVVDRFDPITSLPATFRNTRSHPIGLVEGESYRAEPS
jgi:murein DD-endopeptidase MepM/ murein hydrolase activator NlpD